MRAFRIAALTAAQRAVADRGALAVTVFFYVAVTIVLGALWRAAAAANGGAVVGYGAVALSWYAATAELVTVTLKSRMIEDTGDDIATGAVAVELLRPASVLGLRVANEIGVALPRIALCAVVGCALTTAVAGPPPSWTGLALAAPAVLLAVAVNVVAQHAFAAISFWIRDARATWFVYQKVVFVVGGMLLPLEVLPDALERAARVLPFMAMAYAPARLASGHVEPVLLLVQLGWLVVVSALAVAVFAAGERRLQVVGG